MWVDCEISARERKEGAGERGGNERRVRAKEREGGNERRAREGER